jgi:hypothetical protein
VVECYWPSVTQDQHALAAGRARAAASEARRSGRELQFLGSILIPAEETVFCLFTGREHDVRAASRQAELPFERILESVPSELAIEAIGHQVPADLQGAHIPEPSKHTSGGKVNA